MTDADTKPAAEPQPRKRDGFNYRCPVCLSTFHGDAARRHAEFMRDRTQTTKGRIL